MRIFLDTVAFLWAVDTPELMSERARSAVEDNANELFLSALSISEIAIKHAKGQLAFSLDTTLRAIAELDIRVLPFTAQHAYRFFGLPNHHRDPFDRQIIAQALVEQLPVMTSDRLFARYEGVSVFW